jgi:hypothetical protein
LLDKLSNSVSQLLTLIVLLEKLSIIVIVVSLLTL